MKVLVRAGLSIAVVLTMRGVAIAQEIDPFAEPPPAEAKKAAPGVFDTLGGFKVSPEAGSNPERIPKSDWPKIEAPTSFNRLFVSPDKIWKVDGGYFGAFDGGEWGGALFFAAHGAKKWTRIIDSHILDLECFEGDVFLAAGGLAHLDLVEGAAFLITRLPEGGWQVRMVFSSTVGVPRIVGLSATNAFMKAESKKLVVLGLEDALGCSPYFGLDVTGATHCLGETIKDQSHGAATPSGGDKPSK